MQPDALPGWPDRRVEGSAERTPAQVGAPVLRLAALPQDGPRPPDLRLREPYRQAASHVVAERELAHRPAVPRRLQARRPWEQGHAGLRGRRVRSRARQDEVAILRGAASWQWERRPVRLFLRVEPRAVLQKPEDPHLHLGH